MLIILRAERVKLLAVRFSLCRNNTQKEHAGHETRTRTARRIGTLFV